MNFNSGKIIEDWSNRELHIRWSTPWLGSHHHKVASFHLEFSGQALQLYLHSFLNFHTDRHTGSISTQSFQIAYPSLPGANDVLHTNFANEDVPKKKSKEVEHVQVLLSRV